MKLSKKGIYALRVLRYLALRPGDVPHSVKQIAAAEDIPEKYLEQVVAPLRKRGILISHQGKDGGYQLRRPPEEITLGDIVRAVDGPLAPIPCASRTAPYRCADGPYDYETCWLRHVMLRVRDNISAVLDEVTLAEMAADALAGGEKRRKA